MKGKTKKCLGIIAVFIFGIIVGRLSENGSVSMQVPIEQSSQLEQQTSEQSVEAKQEKPKQEEIAIISIDTKITEKNSLWWKWAWVLKLKNNTSRDQSVKAIIKWTDADSFIIDTDTAYSLLVPAGQEKTFNGFALIYTAPSQNVEAVGVVISQ